MEVNPTRMCALLVGLPAVRVLGVVDVPGEPIAVHVELVERRWWCPACGGRAWVKDRPAAVLVDLPCFGRPARLVWRKHRCWCPEPACENGSWTVEELSVAAARVAMTDRAARWATVQVGSEGRTVAVSSTAPR